MLDEDFNKPAQTEAITPNNEISSIKSKNFKFKKKKSKNNVVAIRNNFTSVIKSKKNKGGDKDNKEGNPLVDKLSQKYAE